MVKTPRAAAIAGIIFTILIATSMILIKLSVVTDPSEADRWLSDNSLKSTVSFALQLIPFAGIAFLWFLGVIRDRLGEDEDRFLATVMLGSGLLYVAMLFASAAMAAGLIGSLDTITGSLTGSQAWEINRNISFTVISVYGIRMAAVFTISTSTIFLRTSRAPRWLCFLGFAVGLLLLLTASFTEWMSLFFYGWVLLVSLVMLALSFKGEPDFQAVEAGPGGDSA